MAGRRGRREGVWGATGQEGGGGRGGERWRPLMLPECSMAPARLSLPLNGSAGTLMTSMDNTCVAPPHSGPSPDLENAPAPRLPYGW